MNLNDDIGICYLMKCNLCYNEFIPGAHFGITKEQILLRSRESNGR
jgi:hypothetical protein